VPTEQLLLLKDISEIRSLQLLDFVSAMKAVTPSVSRSTLADFENWKKEKG